jgi:hypothetical protein
MIADMLAAGRKQPGGLLRRGDGTVGTCVQQRL